MHAELLPTLRQRTTLPCTATCGTCAEDFFDKRDTCVASFQNPLYMQQDPSHRYRPAAQAVNSQLPCPISCAELSELQSSYGEDGPWLKNPCFSSVQPFLQPASLEACSISSALQQYGDAACTWLSAALTKQFEVEFELEVKDICFCSSQRVCNVLFAAARELKVGESFFFTGGLGVTQCKKLKSTDLVLRGNAIC